MRIPEYDEPEPDVAIIRGSDVDYRYRIPTAAEVGLLFEVSDWTLGQDRGEKLGAYAKDGIPVYWIVDVDDGQVEVYSDPGRSGYRSREVLAPGHVLRVAIDGVAVGQTPVADILP